MKAKLLLSTIVFLFTTALFSQSVFRKSYIYGNYNSVRPCPGGGFIMGGSSANYCVLSKTDDHGTVQWSKQYGDPGFASLYNHIKTLTTLDRGFLMVGTYQQGGITYPMLVKTDSLGGIKWMKRYQVINFLNNYQVASDVIATPDSGFVLTGFTSTNNYGLLMKIDKTGNVLWTNCQLGSGNTPLSIGRIIPITGGFMAIGSHNNNNFHVMQISSTGSIIASRVGGSGLAASDIIQASDGNFVVLSRNTNVNTLELVKFDLAGNVYWSKSYNTGAITNPTLIETSTGEYLITFYTSTNGVNFLKVDNIGNNPVQTYIGGGLGVGSDKIQKLSDGSYIQTRYRDLYRFTETFPFSCSTTSLAVTATGVGYSFSNLTVTSNTASFVYTQTITATSMPNTPVTSSCGINCTPSVNITASFTSPDTVCQGQSVPLVYGGTPVSSYVWSDNGNIIAAVANPTYNFNLIGLRKIKLIVTAGSCKDSTLKYVYVKNNCGTNGTPVDYFNKTYNNYSNSNSIVKTSDNGFALAGSTSLLGTPDMCLMKTDSTGAVQWGRSYGNGTLSEYAKIVRQTVDGGYLLIGDNNYVFTVKTNSVGTLQWQNNYQLMSASSPGGSQTITDAIATPDSGAIIIGTSSFNSYGVCFKINKNGGIVWTNHINGIPTLNSIVPTGTGNYIMVGNNTIAKIDGAGNILVTRNFSSAGVFHSVIQHSDGTIIVVGLLGGNITTIRLDSNFNIIWSRQSSINLGTITGLSAKEDLDKGWVISCNSSSYGVALFKHDSYGQEIGQNFITGANPTSKLERFNSGAYALTDGNTLRKFTAFNQLRACNSTTNYPSNYSNPITTSTTSIGTNTYTGINNQFYIASNTSHTLTTNCSNPGCNTIAQFQSPFTACVGQPINLINTSIGGISYTWKENNVPFATTTNATWAFGAPITYTLSLDVVGQSGCNGTYSIVVNVSNAPSASVSSNTSITCGGSTTLTASGGSFYNWSPSTGLSNPNIASPVASPTTTTNYTVNVSNGSGCSSSAVVTVSVSGMPAVGITGVSSICTGNSAVLTATGATTYTWSANAGSATTNTVNVSPSSTTIYTVTGANGSCTKTSTLSLTVNTTPTASAGASQTITCTTPTISLSGSGVSTYTWSGPGIVSGGNSANPIVNAGGTYSLVGTTGSCKSNTALVTISSNTTAPAVSITAISNSICAGGTTTLTAAGANTYSWSTGSTATSIIISPTVTTNYVLTGTTSANGCTNSTNQTISVTPTPTANASASQTITCTSPTISLSGSGVSTYTWSGPGIVSGGNSANPIVNLSGTYSLVGTTNSCKSNTATVVVSSNTTVPSVSISTSTTTICSGSSLTLTASGANTYSWSTGATSSSIVVSPTASVTYSVTGTNSVNGCSASASKPITVNSSPFISVNSGSICSGNSFTLIGSGASTYTYSSGPIVSPTTTTSYSVTGTSAAGCLSSNTAISNVTVNTTPTITVNSGSICSGQSFTLSASGASSYTYSSGSVVSPATTTSYSVTGSTAGCISNVAVSNVTVSATPTISLAGGAICPGNSFTLSPSGANTYTFSSGPVVSPSSTTSYSVSGTSTAGCVSASPAVATVTVANSLTVTISGSNTICDGNSVSLTAGGATSYTWNTSATSNSISATPSVNTTYTVIGASGSCTNTAAFSVTVNPTPTVSAVTSSSLICSGQTATLTATGASSYTWNPGGAGASISVSPTVTATYTLTGSNSFGCTNSTMLTQNVSACTGVNTISGAGTSVAVYPNPFNSNLFVEASVGSHIQIFNALGSLVYSTKTEIEKTEIDLSLQASGIYFIKVGNTTRKIIKE